MGAAADELYEFLRHWSHQHKLSGTTVVVILSRMISNYSDDAFDERETEIAIGK